MASWCGIWAMTIDDGTQMYVSWRYALANVVIGSVFAFQTVT
jgi:hypothetical protein